MRSTNRFGPHEQTYLSLRAWHVNGDGQRPFSGVVKPNESICVHKPYSRNSSIHFKVIGSIGKKSRLLTFLMDSREILTAFFIFSNKMIT